MTEGNFVYYNGEKARREAFRPDMAAMLDSPAECLAERFAVGITVAMSIYNWHVQIVERTEKLAFAKALGVVASYAMRDCQNWAVKKAGMAFALNLYDELSVESQAAAAARLGVTRASISNAKKEFERYLVPHGIILSGKSAAACERYRAARLKHLQRQKNGNQ